MVRDPKVRGVSLTQEGQRWLLAQLKALNVTFPTAQGGRPDISDLWEGDVPWGQMATTALKVILGSGLARAVTLSTPIARRTARCLS